MSSVCKIKYGVIPHSLPSASVKAFCTQPNTVSGLISASPVKYGMRSVYRPSSTIRVISVLSEWPNTMSGEMIPFVMSVTSLHAPAVGFSAVLYVL